MITEHPPYYRKPHIRLKGYDPARYCVLVCRDTGAVFFAGAYSYKPAAFRQSSQWSPSKRVHTYRCCVVRPGEDLLASVNWVIQGWEPSPLALSARERLDRLHVSRDT